MTIEEKAKEYESNIGSQDYVATEIEQAFIEGAEWMFEEVINWLKDNSQNYYYSSSQADNCYFDDEELIEDFKKAMEE